MRRTAILLALLSLLFASACDSGATSVMGTDSDSDTGADSDSDADADTASDLGDDTDSDTASDLGDDTDSDTASDGDPLDGISLADPLAIDPAKILYKNLQGLAPDKLMYGQHQPTTVGDTIDNGGDTTDCKTITGDHPALYGFDLGQVSYWSATDDSKPFNQHIPMIAGRGGVITISWHQDNPATGGNYDDTSGDPVTQILTAGTTARSAFFADLDEAGLFLTSLTRDGQPIPVLWRPLHEQLHGAFWWGKDTCTATEYADLWRLMFDYMTSTLEVHNLIWVFSPNKPDDRAEYESRFPGYQYMDVLGFDYYADGDFSGALLNSARLVSTLASEQGKLAAITESGWRNFTGNDWFTSHIMGVMNDPVAKEVAWFMTWRSPQFTAFPPPGPNDNLYEDFMAFHDNPDTLFEPDLPDMYKL